MEAEEDDDVKDGIGPVAYLGGVFCILFLLITVFSYATGK